MLFLFPLVSLGQEARYAVEEATYSLKEGLSNRIVYCVQEDGRGILWVGTHFGLNRFDGRRFRTFTKADGLAGNFIRSIFPLDGEHLLLGLDEWQRDLPNTRIPQAFNVLTHRPVPLIEAMPDMPFTSQDIREISLINNGLHFALHNGQNYLRDSQGRFTPIPFLGKGETLWSCNPGIHAWVSYIRQDSFFVKRYNLISNTETEVFLTKGVDSAVRLLKDSEDGSAHFSVNYSKEPSTAIVRVNTFGITTTLYQFPDKQGRFFELVNIQYDPTLGAYWCGRRDSFFLFSENWVPLLQVENPGSSYLNHNRLNHYESQHIWQCSSAGLHRISLRPRQFNVLFQEAEPLSFRGIIRVGDKILFNSNRGIYQKTLNTTSLFSPVSGLSSATGPDSSFWTGNITQIHCFEPGSQTSRTYSIERVDLWGLWVAPDQKVWYSSRGIRYLDPLTRQDTVPVLEGFEELSEATAYHFHEHTRDTIWLCTTEGLYVLDAPGKTVLSRYWPGGQGAHYLPSSDLRHLYWDDEAGEAWIATGDNGLLLWRPSKGEVLRYLFPKQNTNVLHAVYADAYGFLWLPTDDGLVQFERNSGHFHIYTVQDGLPSNEFNRCSHYQDEDGRLYFGTINGVVNFHPMNFRDMLQFVDSRVKPVVLDVIKQLRSSDQQHEFTSTFFYGEGLKMRSSDLSLSILFSLSEISEATDAAYYYQLQGEIDWRVVQGNQLSLWRLPYGQQRLLVKARLSDGSYTQELEIPLYVQPPFYLTWWFALLVVLLLGGLVSWRLRSLRLSNLILERQVKQRTEQIRHNMELIEQQAEELRQLDELKSRFFANISHELRTPLTLISAPLQRLAREETNPQKRQALRFAAKNSQRLLRLINQILDLSKLQAVKLIPEPQPVQLRPFVRRVLAEFESFAAHKGVALKFQTKLSESATTDFDPKMVETVLYNLLSNALKFTPAGGRVVLTLKEIMKGLAFEITDNGRGILPEDLPFIFDRFYQSRTQQAAEGGTGIGLAICREFVQLLGGNLHAESMPGQGTTFFFSLPVNIYEGTAAPAEPLEEEQELVSPTASAAQEGRPRLLIVEDNEDLQQYLASLLEPFYQLVRTNNGRAALDFLQTCPEEELPALILSDVMMPEMDGFQLLQQLKGSSLYRHIPVVMLTARAGTDDRLRALRIGVDDYLAKPFAEDELMVRIRNLVHRSSLKAHLGEFLMEAKGKASDATSAETDATTNWLAEVENYVLKNMNKPTFSVSTVAEAFGMSRFKFTRQIALETGMTAAEYFLEVRLSEARRLLEAQPERFVKDIATAVGFPDPKLFARKFQQRFGLYPSEAR